MSKIEVNKVEPQCGTTLTLGGSGHTVTLGTGASQSGFGREGSVDWQTGSIKTAATFTAASGEGYFVDTSSNAITANLPAGSAGAIVAFSDYARNFSNNNLTISPNGSEKIGGIAASSILDVDGQAITLVYVDSTKGWINVQNAEDTETGVSFISATGGTITTVCTNFKVHTFTGPGTFCVSSISSTAEENIVSYLVLAGGGGGGKHQAGGGGAGGYRELKSPTTPYTASPLDGYPTSSNRVSITATAFPIAVGSGGAAGTVNCAGTGTPGAASTFSTITSAGGGGGGTDQGGPTPGSPGTAGDGGSGGGGRGGNKQGEGVPTQGVAGTANTGGGAGGGTNSPALSPNSTAGNSGGKGIVVIRYKFQ